MSDQKVSKGGKALSALNPSKGGKARAASLTLVERHEIARRAADTRWNNDVPKATHTGQLAVQDRVIACAMLENGKRLLTQETFLTAIGRAAKAKGGTGSERLTGATALVDGLPPFLAAENLKSFISDELRASTSPIVFRNPTGTKAYGYDAALLPMVCDVYLEARKQGVLLASQKRIADMCEILVRGLARVGIIALVDEATGYQEQRARDELNKILEAYIVAELQPWIKMFPDEFFRQIYRLHGWKYTAGSTSRTPYIGKLINRLVYEQLPPGVLDELRLKNPVTGKGYRKHKHHQFLTVETGNIHLDRQISTVTTLMRISANKDEFEEHFAKAFKPAWQERIPLIVDAIKPEADQMTFNLVDEVWNSSSDTA